MPICHINYLDLLLCTGFNAGHADLGHSQTCLSNRECAMLAEMLLRLASVCPLMSSM